ncbi:MAG: hypothetical protein IPK82_24055 [Polyangiaceae bacterium]|nr:hypothetical protein [Polyangiaceae bacterium]
MRVFEPTIEPGYEWINCEHPTDYEVFGSFDGTPKKPTWRPIAVKRVRADKKHDFKASDFPWIGSDALIMRRAAVDALHDFLEANGEVLPLTTTDGIELFVLNAQVIDCLDLPNSSVMFVPGTSRIMHIKKAVFIASAIGSADIFRLPHRGSVTYVSERFVERVKSSGLVGLAFKMVWSD